MSNNVSFMKEAIELSRASAERFRKEGKVWGGPFGAVVVKDNQIVGKSWNKVLENNDPSAHAEVSAIRDACKNLNTWNLEGCTLYTSCEPCPMCLMTLRWANINEIYYAADRVDAESVGFKDNDLYHDLKDDVYTGTKIPELKAEAVSAMEEWNKVCGDNLY